MGSSVIEPCGRAKVHSPSQSSVPVTLIAGTWNRCSIASRGRNRVVGDRRAEHREATLVDQFPVRVDDRLRRALGQSLHLPEDDLHRPIDHSLLHAFVEHQLEGLEKIVPLLLREALGKPEVAEVTQLDRLGAALVGHVAFPLDRNEPPGPSPLPRDLILGLARSPILDVGEQECDPPRRRLLHPTPGSARPDGTVRFFV